LKPGIKDLPAVKWKLMNTERLEKRKETAKSTLKYYWEGTSKIWIEFIFNMILRGYKFMLFA